MAVGGSGGTKSPGEIFDEAWQTVNDTFFDPTFAGVDWDRARRELRPEAEAAASPDEVRRVIGALLARLQRSHFVLLPAAGTADSSPDLEVRGSIGAATVPIEVRIAADGVIVTRVHPESSAGRAGLRAGQRLLRVDGLATAGWTATDAGPAARRRAFDLWRRVNRALHGTDGSTAALTVRGPDAVERTTDVRRIREAGEVVALGNLPPLAVRTDVRELRSPSGLRVGFIGFNVWMTAIDAPIADAVDRFRQADGLVIDLRGNPGGLTTMLSGLAGHFIADPDVVLGRMRTREATLEFRVNPRNATPDGRRVRPYAGPVAVLVDELTGSASECFAGALQDLGRARIFGRQTRGEALPALTRRLANGDVLVYAVGDFVTPTGRTLEGEGVIPDEVVPLSGAALAAGRDESLEAALRWLEGISGRQASRQAPAHLP